jgi:hypothetical protein
LKVDERKDCDLDKIISYLSSVDGDPNKLLDYVKCYIRSFDKERDEKYFYITQKPASIQEQTISHLLILTEGNYLLSRWLK